MPGFPVSLATKIRALDEHGLNVSNLNDFYSPLPYVPRLLETAERWNRPSRLGGIEFDVDGMKARLADLVVRYHGEFLGLPSYEETNAREYGLGYPMVDAMVLYFMVRDLKPKLFVEIGSGLSTYYCSLAMEANAREGVTGRQVGIDPLPYPALSSISGVELIEKEAQDVGLSFFEDLGSGDILFIDSTHVVKVGGEVPYLYLEVLPELAKGVVVQCHDIPFPYNFPFPPEYWIFGVEWPVFWNEAMLVQAFLAYNRAYSIVLSVPFLQHFDADFLELSLPGYEPLEREMEKSYPEVPSALWLQKIQ